jgi:FkbM family methyltransferase
MSTLDRLGTLGYRAADALPEAVRKAVGRAAQRLLDGRLRAFYSQFVFEGDLVFDIGANLGDVSQVFLDLGAWPVCVEPNPDTARALRRRLGNGQGAVVIEAGLSDAEGTEELLICSAHPSTCTIEPDFTETRRYGHRSWDRASQIDVTTLDRLVERYGLPAFCKIDVEGAELRVLRGLSAALPLLSFEYTPDLEREAADCVAHLDALGSYDYNFAPHYSYALSADPWLGGAELLDSLASGAGSWWYGDIYARER